MINMQLDSKRCAAFLAVVETGSFDNAGNKLCLTPSAVSLRLQALEKDLGQLLLIRGKPCSLTQAGETLLAHLRHIRLLEQNLWQNLTGQLSSGCFRVVLAVNADSLATWLLPVLQPVLLTENIILELNLDDQSRTHQLLEKGMVNACISTQATPMRGCYAQLMGSMTYRMVANNAFIQRWFNTGVNRDSLRHAPAVIFNDKDPLHVDVLHEQFGLLKGSYPSHFIPSSEAFVQAIKLGLGYGMVPEFQLGDALTTGELIEIIPTAITAVPLYWHYWQQQARPLAVLTAYLLSQDLKLNGSG